MPPLIESGAPMLVGGVRQWVSFEAPNFQGDDFEALGAELERTTHTVAVGKVGEAACRLIGRRAAVDFAIDWLRMHRP